MGPPILVGAESFSRLPDSLFRRPAPAAPLLSCFFDGFLNKSGDLALFEGM